MPLSEGWHDQYERMLRSHQRLVEAAGPSAISSAEARDRLYHFFQDAYHLKDWLKNDPTTKAKATEHPKVEGLFNTPGQSVLWLQLCADLCNGVKHLVLAKEAKTGDKNTAFTNQSVRVGLPALETGWDFGGPYPNQAFEPAKVTATHQWVVTSNNQTFDAMKVANEVLVEWKNWLEKKSLL